MRTAGGDSRDRGLAKSIDWWLVACWVLLVVIGWWRGFLKAVFGLLDNLASGYNAYPYTYEQSASRHRSGIANGISFRFSSRPVLRRTHLALRMRRSDILHGNSPARLKTLNRRQPPASSHIKPFHYTGFFLLLQEKYSFFCVIDVEIYITFLGLFCAYCIKIVKKHLFRGIFMRKPLFLPSIRARIFRFFCATSTFLAAEWAFCEHIAPFSHHRPHARFFSPQPPI